MAGGEGDLEWLESHAAEHGVKKIVRLKVAGAFHTPFMAAAVPALEAAVAAVSFSPPTYPVWSNVTARPAPAAETAALLVRQVVSPVLFAETLAGLSAAGIDTFVHVGPGDVTAGMARRTVPSARVVVANRADGIRDAAASIGTID
jgi:[acyl-carrier-protein] S-malonyltransferase